MHLHSQADCLPSLFPTLQNCDASGRGDSDQNTRVPSTSALPTGVALPVPRCVHRAVHPVPAEAQAQAAGVNGGVVFLGSRQLAQASLALSTRLRALPRHCFHSQPCSNGSLPSNGPRQAPSLRPAAAAAPAACGPGGRGGAQLPRLSMPLWQTSSSSDSSSSSRSRGSNREGSSSSSSSSSSGRPRCSFPLRKGLVRWWVWQRRMHGYECVRKRPR